MASNSLSQARAAARQNNLNRLDSLGSSKSDFEMADVFSALENSAADFITRVKENIIQLDLPVTGQIEDIKLEVTDTGINILANPWLIYQDRGVNGSVNKLYDTPFSYSDKMPPPDVFVDYIKRKNINLRHEENYDIKKVSPFEDLSGDEKEIQKAAFGMAMNVFKNGFKPQPIFNKEIPKLVEDITEVLKDVVTDFITASIKDKYGTDLFKKGKK